MAGAMEILGILVVVYFFPAIVAYSRRHKNAGAILVLTLILGWTFIGWAVALIWASTSNTAPRPSKDEPAGGILGVLKRRKDARQISDQSWNAQRSSGLLGLDDRGDGWRGMRPLPDDEHREK